MLRETTLRKAEEAIAGVRPAALVGEVPATEEVEAAAPAVEEVGDRRDKAEWTSADR